MTVMWTPDGPLSRLAPLASAASALSSEPRWSDDDDMDLPDVTAGRGERASQGRGRRVHGEQREARRRRQQGAGILAADCRRCGARQEASDVAQADEVAGQQALNK